MAQSTPSSYEAKANAFFNDACWCNGTSWGASKTPRISSHSATGCAAYAADFSKYVFGVDNPNDGQAFRNPSEIRAGDVIKVTGSQH